MVGVAGRGWIRGVVVLIIKTCKEAHSDSSGRKKSPNLSSQAPRLIYNCDSNLIPCRLLLKFAGTLMSKESTPIKVSLPYSKTQK